MDSQNDVESGANTVKPTVDANFTSSTASILVPRDTVVSTGISVDVDLNVNSKESPENTRSVSLGVGNKEVSNEKVTREQIDKTSFTISNPEPQLKQSNLYEDEEKMNDEVLVTVAPTSNSFLPHSIQEPPSEPLSADMMDTYHPPHMYCGECTSCSNPPPPLNDAMFSFDQDNKFFTVTDFEEEPDDIENSKTNSKGNENKVETEEVEMMALDASKATASQKSNSSERSKFQLQNLTDPSQVLAINALIRPLPGVTKILANAKKKLVFVDHDPFATPASLIFQVLTNQGGFKVEILWDAGSSIQDTTNPSGICRSVLRVMEGLCCSSEIPTLKNILESTEGVREMKGVNITTKGVYLEHDPFVISIQEICDVLTAEGFRSIVKRDGARQLSRQNANHSKSDKQSKSNASSNADSIGSPPLSSFRQGTYVESTLRIGYLSSLAHVKAIERALKEANSQKRQQTGKKRMVRAFHPHPPSKTIKIEHDANFISALDLAVILSNDGGVGAVEVLEDGAAVGRVVHSMKDDDLKDSSNSSNTVNEEDFLDGVKVNVILSGIFWIMSMMTYFGGRWEKLKYCGLLSVVFGLPPIAKKAWRTVKRRQFDANCMMLIAAVGALFLQEYDEAASVAFLFAISELLEARATSRARRALSAIVNIRPDYANVVDEETNEITIGVPSDRVAVGTLVSVRTGDKVPCDGVVVSGTSLIDESSLTGEAKPIQKHVQDEVTGGSINIGNTQLLVRTSATVDDSAVSRLIQLVEEAQANRSATEKIIDSFAKKYTPIVVVMAFIMCTIPWAWGAEVGRYWSLNGLIIIVIACPCALTISTPVTYSAGLAATAQQGIIVKGGARLEALGMVKKVVFDKTGTLTKGKFELTHLLPIGNKYTRKQILELLLVMEAPSSHPLSSTLVQAAYAEKVSIPKNTILKDHEILQGEGVTGFVNGQQIYVGNYRLFDRLKLYHLLSKEDQCMFDIWNSSGGTVGFVGNPQDGIIGAFCVMDTVREEACEVIMGMQEYGIEVVMLTGDGAGAAKNIGNQVGLPDEKIVSQLKPDDKLHFVGSLKGSRKLSSWRKERNLVLMCGDGVNDAPALAVSDVGVAMGGGAALALEMSDVTLLDSNLKKLFFSIKMGRRTIWAIEENILFSLVTKTIVVGFTFAGYMTLFSAIALDVGVMLIVTLNGMKLLPTDKSNWEKLVEGDTQHRRLFRSPPRKKKYLTLPIDGEPMHTIV